MIIIIFNFLNLLLYSFQLWTVNSLTCFKVFRHIAFLEYLSILIEIE